ncbi:NUDIX domain-containing protein [Micromonospora arida]
MVRAVSGSVVLDKSGRILMHMREDDGTWCLPGGGVKPGETWEQAARRECLEETGWVISIDGLLGVYSDPHSQIHQYPGGANIHIFSVAFLASPLYMTQVIFGVRWFGRDSLPKSLFPPNLTVLRDLTETRSGPFVR